MPAEVRAAAAFATFVLAVALTGCASKAPQPRPVVGSIDVIPAIDPEQYELENKTALQFLSPLLGTMYAYDSKVKAKQFNERLRADHSGLGMILTNEVVERLRALGYRVFLADVQRDPDDRDNIDLERVKTAQDSILHLRFAKVGLESPRTEPNYQPRVNAVAKLVVPGGKIDIYYEDISFGIDAKPGDKFGILADATIAYPTIETVLEQSPLIEKVFQDAARQIGAKMAEQIHETIRLR